MDILFYVQSIVKYSPWLIMRRCFFEDLPQEALWSKFEDPSPCGYLDTKLNATGEYFRKGARARKQMVLH
ncbi:MAG: hypothetical protein AB2693_24945 [Candidatus Thiodiazotropha sp.]